MTGFARVRKTIPEGEIVLSVKSVNHRFLDLKIRLPEGVRSACQRRAENNRREPSDASQRGLAFRSCATSGAGGSIGSRSANRRGIANACGGRRLLRGRLSSGIHSMGLQNHVRALVREPLLFGLLLRS